jgi:hypothetical protein
MRVRLKTLMTGPEGVFPIGLVIDVGDEEAAALIAGGFAERLDRPVFALFMNVVRKRTKNSTRQMTNPYE